MVRMDHWISGDFFSCNAYLSKLQDTESLRAFPHRLHDQYTANRWSSSQYALPRNNHPYHSFHLVLKLLAILPNGEDLWIWHASRMGPKHYHRDRIVKQWYSYGINKAIWSVHQTIEVKMKCSLLHNDILICFSNAFLHLFTYFLFSVL